MRIEFALRQEGDLRTGVEGCLDEFVDYVLTYAVIPGARSIGIYRREVAVDESDGALALLVDGDKLDPTLFSRLPDFVQARGESLAAASVVERRRDLGVLSVKSVGTYLADFFQDNARGDTSEAPP